MRLFRNPKPLPVEPRPDNHRRFGRVRTQFLECHLGVGFYATVLDLSRTGMRLHRAGGAKFKAGDTTNWTLHWQEAKIPVQGKIAWIKRLGFRRHLLGIEFVNMNVNNRTAVAQLGSLAADSFVIASSKLQGGRHRHLP